MDAGKWRQTNGDTVVLCTLGYDRRVFGSGDEIVCSAVISDFSHPPFSGPTLRWELSGALRSYASDTLEINHKPFCAYEAHQLRIHIPHIEKPDAAILKFTLDENGRRVSNQWPVWLFPSETQAPDGVHRYSKEELTWIKTAEEFPVVPEGVNLDPASHPMVLAEEIDDCLAGYLLCGGKVLIAAAEGLVRPMRSKLGLVKGRYFFTPPANYPPYEDGLDGTIIQNHPALESFYHEGFADLQFYRMLSESPPIDLEPTGLNGADPVIRAMHTYMVGRSLGYLVEASAGKGALILCSLDLDQSFCESRHLLGELCSHALGADFAPSLRLTDDQLRTLCRHTGFS